MFAFANAQTKDTLVSVGNHMLNFRLIEGEGLPIVFESGGGNDGSVWLQVQSLLKEKINAPLIAYDRAGFGNSGLDTNRIDINNEVRDLALGLNTLGFRDGYFFVAHSLGGNYAMRFIANNPSKVKGAVFIDVVSPAYMTAERARETKAGFMEDIAEIKAESLGFYHLVLNYEHTSQVMRALADSINLPMLVIGSGISPFEGELRVEFIAGLKAFADARANRSYLLVSDAEHYVFYDKPNLVADEIVKLYLSVLD